MIGTIDIPLSLLVDRIRVGRAYLALLSQEPCYHHPASFFFFFSFTPHAKQPTTAYHHSYLLSRFYLSTYLIQPTTPDRSSILLLP